MSTSIYDYHLNAGRPLYHVFSTFFLHLFFFCMFLMEKDVKMLKRWFWQAKSVKTVSKYTTIKTVKKIPLRSWGLGGANLVLCPTWIWTTVRPWVRASAFSAGLFLNTHLGYPLNDFVKIQLSPFRGGFTDGGTYLS